MPGWFGLLPRNLSSQNAQQLGRPYQHCSCLICASQITTVAMVGGKNLMVLEGKAKDVRRSFKCNCTYRPRVPGTCSCMPGWVGETEFVIQLVSEWANDDVAYIAIHVQMFITSSAQVSADHDEPAKQLFTWYGTLDHAITSKAVERTVGWST